MRVILVRATRSRCDLVRGAFCGRPVLWWVYYNYTYCVLSRALCVDSNMCMRARNVTRRGRLVPDAARRHEAVRINWRTAAHRCNCVPHTSIRTVNNTGTARTAYVTIITAGKLRTCNAEVFRTANSGPTRATRYDLKIILCAWEILFVTNRIKILFCIVNQAYFSHEIFENHESMSYVKYIVLY